MSNAPTESASGSSSDAETVLFDFTRDSSLVNDWIEVSDVIREAGKSKGVLVAQTTHQFQRAIFFSLLNPQPSGAAFAGVAYRKSAFDLNSFSGMKIVARAQGENFVYKISLRHCNQESSLDPSYEIFFQMPKNIFTEKYLPFEEFKPYSRGRPLDPNTTPPLDRTRISSIGLQIVGGVYSEFQQSGASSLEIDSISAVRRSAGQN